MKQAVIIGAGPAGISAAIYLVRAHIPTTVIYRDAGALGKASAIENYYGFPTPVTGQELFEAGLKQAQNLGVELIHDEVTGISWLEKLTVLTPQRSFGADVLILATGASRVTPKIKGLREFEGRGVSYCAVCDAFFYRNKNVAVIGNGQYALHEALELSHSARAVTIFTLGLPSAFDLSDAPDNITIDARKVTDIVGDDAVNALVLEDGSKYPVDGVFVAVGVAGSTDFARKVGAEIDGARIRVDENFATNIPGLYACGDAVGGMLQVSKAVGDGAKAAAHAIRYWRAL